MSTRTIYIRVVFFVLTIYVVLGNSSPINNSIPTINHKYYSVNVLDGNWNAFTLLSSRGELWISSTEGPIVLRGSKKQRIERFPFVDRNVQSPFFENANGDIWFTTLNSLNKYDARLGRYINYNANASFEEDFFITAFYLESGRWLWGVADNQLFKLDTEKEGFSPIWYDVNVDAIRFDVQVDELRRVRKIIGAKWWIGKELEVFYFNDCGEFETKSNIGIEEDAIFSNATVLNENAFLSTSNGVYKMDLTDNELEKCVFGDLDNVEVYTKLQKDKNGELIIGFYSGDIIRYDFSVDGEYELLRKGNNDKLVSLDLDSQSNIWFALKDKGIFQLIQDKRNFMNIVLDYTLSTSVLGFERGQGRGIFIRTQEENLLVNYEGNYLEGFEEKKFSFKDINGGEINGRLYFSAFQGDFAIYSYYTGTYLVRKSSGEILNYFPDFAVVDIFFRVKDSSEVLLGNADRIFIYDIKNGEDSIQSFNYRTTKTHATLDTLRNCYWITTARGLLQLDRTTFQPTWLTEANHNLPAIWYQAVAIDEYQNLWLSSNQGIYHYKPDDKADPITHYTDRDGLTSNEYNMGATITDSLGRIWFGSTKGVDIIDPSKVGEKSPPPKLMITELMIFDKPYEGEKSIMVEDAIELPYYHNTLTVEMAALHYADPERNTYYAYMRGDGQAADTIDYNTQNKVTYVNLDPGHYQFGFTAANPEGVKNPVYKTLDIYIVPPYWQTWWFRTLAVLLIASLFFGAIIAYYRYRLREQKFLLEKQQIELRNELSLQKERNRIANEMHDDLGGKLSTILFAGKRMKRSKSLEEANTVMERVNKISLELIDSMKSIIWAMDSENDDLDSLLSIIRNVTTKFGYDNELSMQVDIPEEYPDIQLRGAIRHNVLLTVKEALNNALKHANATQIHLQITLADNQFQISITDNGKGFAYHAALGKGKGLRNMKRRIESIGGQIEWVALEQGMCVEIIVPIRVNEN